MCHICKKLFQDEVECVRCHASFCPTHARQIGGSSYAPVCPSHAEGGTANNITTARPVKVPVVADAVWEVIESEKIMLTKEMRRQTGR